LLKPLAGRVILGIELDAEYHAIASRRLNEDRDTPATVAR
jgi:DNA modification methylase